MIMIMMLMIMIMMILRDYNISGRINLMEIPVLLHMLHFWKVSTSNYLIFDKYAELSLLELTCCVFTATIRTFQPLLTNLYPVFIMYC